MTIRYRCLAGRDLVDPHGRRLLDEVVLAASVSGTTGGPRPSGGFPPPYHRRDDDPGQTRVEGLVALAQAGDADAFGQIYELYVDTVYRYVYVRVGSHPLAEDLTSETFVRALRRLDSFSWQGRDIAAWFVTIARNLVVDHVKSGRFRLEVTTAELLDVESDTATEEQALLRLRDERLMEAVRQLRADQQECVVLRFFQGLSLAETAQVLGRTQGAVKQLQLRAVRALARMMEAGRP